MKCVEVEQQLNFLADGEVDLSRKEEIERHLQNCPKCQNTLERLQFVGAFLKQPVSAPPNLDRRVLESFRKHHADKKPLPVLKEKRRFFGRIFVPVPIFAVVLALFALTIGAAYQLGKMSVVKVASTSGKPAETMPEKVSEPIQNSPERVEIPVTKIVRVPIIKERKVLIYKYKSSEKSVSPALENSSLAKTESKSNEFLTRFNLKGFQPVSELKPRIIEKEKNQ